MSTMFHRSVVSSLPRVQAPAALLAVTTPDRGSTRSMTWLGDGAGTVCASNGFGIKRVTTGHLTEGLT